MEKTTNCFYHFFLASFQSVIASLYSVILRSEATKNLNRGQSTMKSYFVYILTNWNNKVMYIGITNNLERRMYEHKHKLVDGFTKRYNVNKLVYYEVTLDIHEAIRREKQLKGFKRSKKNALVETINPLWEDLNIE